MSKVFQKTYRLMLAPHPQVLITAKEKWMMGATIEYLKAYGEKKNKEQTDKGAKCPVAPNYYLNRRKRYQKYFEFKNNLVAECRRNLLAFPTNNFWIRLYFEMPPSWSKKKKNRMAFSPHVNKPDADNICKAIFDAMFEDDSIVYDYRVSKFWSPVKGFIEIQVGGMDKCEGYVKLTATTDELK